MKILFVCTGNTCRSPMAEGLFREMLRKENISSVTEVSSAGINAIPHQLASLNSIEAISEKGVDLEPHVSQMLTMDLVESFDLILTMTQSHKQSILGSVPWLDKKVFTLKEYVEQSGDISDPFGGTLEIYKESLKDIESSLKLLIEKIKEEEK